MGNAMNNHNWDIAQSPTNKAWLMLRAGLTDVLVTGILTRWMSVSARPMAIPAKPLGGLLISGSENNDQEHERHNKLRHHRSIHAVFTRRMVGKAMAAKSPMEEPLPVTIMYSYTRSGNRAKYLQNNIRQHSLRVNTPAGPKTDGDSRV